jgi:maltose/moltooligosaccharide transporter
VKEAGSPEAGPSRTLTVLYSSASIGTGAFYAFNNFVLPPVLKSFGAPDLLIGLLSSTRSIEGALIQPTIGALSDRIWTPVGRRRPFMLIGIPLSALFFVAGAFVSSLLPLAVIIFLFSIFFNIAVDPYTALLADVVALEHRGWVSGLSTGVQLVSSVAFLVVVYLATAGGAGVPLWIYIFIAVVLLISFGITVFGVHEPRQRTSESPHIAFREYVDAVVEQHQALRYLGTLFVYQFGLNAILPYLVLFITEDIHQTEQVGFGLSAVLLVVTALGAIGFGRLADRIGTRLVMAIGWGLLAISAVCGVVVQDISQVALVVLVAGVGNGAATAVSWPLLTALIPPEKTGVFAGLKAAAESIAIPLSVVVAAEVFLPRFGYRGIFAMLAITIVVALALLLAFVHPSRGGETGQTRRT